MRAREYEMSERRELEAIKSMARNVVLAYIEEEVILAVIRARHSLARVVSVRLDVHSMEYLEVPMVVSVW